MVRVFINVVDLLVKVGIVAKGAAERGTSPTPGAWLYQPWS